MTDTFLGDGPYKELVDSFAANEAGAILQGLIDAEDAPVGECFVTLASGVTHGVNLPYFLVSTHFDYLSSTVYGCSGVVAGIDVDSVPDALRSAYTSVVTQTLEGAKRRLESAVKG